MGWLKWSAVTLPLLATGCGPDAQPEFRLVGVYDSSAVTALDIEAPDDFLWKPSSGMNDSCGGAKGADGVGLYDAELISQRMSPTLAIVLEHTEDIDTYLKKRRASAMARARDIEGSAFNQERWEREWNARNGKDIRRPAVTNDDITLALGIEKGEFRLEPATMPRHIAVRIDGDDTNIRYQQLVRTQMEVELCMEHKVGRGWTAARGNQLRQAFLLDEPEGNGKDRRYFGGQRDPVPPLLGPSDACLRVSDSLKTGATNTTRNRGEGSTDLVPSDVWGASLRDCAAIEGKGQRVNQPAPVVPLNLSEVNDPQGRQREVYWSDLVIEVGTGEQDEDIKVTVTYEDSRLGDDWEPTIMEDEPLFSYEEELDEAGRKQGGMTDLLAKLPHAYPTVGPRYDPDKYVVLLVPNWQINEGLRRIFDRTCEDTANRCVCTVTSRDGTFTCLDDYNESCELSADELTKCAEQRRLDNPMRTAGLGAQDGVGWVLENPDLLFVQVDTLTDPESLQENAFDRFAAQVDAWWSTQCPQLPWPLTCEADAGGPLKPNLSVVTQGGPLGIQDWGYVAGQKTGRAPVALPIPTTPSWMQGQEAQRARQHSIFLVMLGTMLSFMFIGIRRMPDLWTRTPEERAYYWPGRQSEKEQEEVDPEGVNTAAESNGGEEG